MNAEDYHDPQGLEEQARADAIRAEAGEIRARDLGCASCAALRERAEAAEDVWKPTGPVCWRCKGMGEVPTPFGGDPDRGVPENDTCPECRGDGKGKWE